MKGGVWKSDQMQPKQINCCMHCARISERRQKITLHFSNLVFSLTSPFIDWGQDEMESVCSVPTQEFCKSGGVLSLLPHRIPPEDGIHCLWTVRQLLAHGVGITKQKKKKLEYLHVHRNNLYTKWTYLDNNRTDWVQTEDGRHQSVHRSSHVFTKLSNCQTVCQRAPLRVLFLFLKRSLSKSLKRLIPLLGRHGQDRRKRVIVWPPPWREKYGHSLANYVTYIHVHFFFKYSPDSRTLGPIAALLLTDNSSFYAQKKTAPGNLFRVTK